MTYLLRLAPAAMAVFGMLTVGACSSALPTDAMQNNASNAASQQAVEGMVLTGQDQ